MPLRRMNKRGGANKRKRGQEAEDGAEAERPSSQEVEKKEEEVKEEKKNNNKRAKKSAEPEYLEDQRNLEDLWKSAFPVGTEWDLLDKVYEFNWNFSNLEAAFEEGGVLYRKKVYLFGCSEPQFVSFKDKDRVISVPAVVAAVSPFPPSDKIGITSIQRENEEIVPMKHMKMDWTPYIPLEERDSQVDRLKLQIFTLTCNQRRVALRHMKIDRVKKFDYCLPHFYNPLLEEMSEETRRAYEEIKLYKFYPVQTPDTPDISRYKLASLALIEAKKMYS